MMNTFEMNDFRILCCFLGLEVKQRPFGIFISHKNYAKGLLKRYSMYRYKKTLTPMDINEKMQIDDGNGGANAKY